MFGTFIVFCAGLKFFFVVVDLLDATKLKSWRTPLLQMMACVVVGSVGMLLRHFDI